MHLARRKFDPLAAIVASICFPNPTVQSQPNPVGAPKGGPVAIAALIRHFGEVEQSVPVLGEMRQEACAGAEGSIAGGSAGLGDFAEFGDGDVALQGSPASLEDFGQMVGPRLVRCLKTPI